MRIAQNILSKSPVYASDGYRYGFNSMECDQEVKGQGNSYTTEFRQYDPRVARWLSLDPLAMNFPWQSPLIAFNNNPIYFIDPLGLEGIHGKQHRKIPKIKAKVEDATKPDFRIESDNLKPSATDPTLMEAKHSLKMIHVRAPKRPPNWFKQVMWMANKGTAWEFKQTDGNIWYDPFYKPTAWQKTMYDFVDKTPLVLAGATATPFIGMAIGGAITSSPFLPSAFGTSLRFASKGVFVKLGTNYATESIASGSLNPLDHNALSYPLALALPNVSLTKITSTEIVLKQMFIGASGGLVDYNINDNKFKGFWNQSNAITLLKIYNGATAPFFGPWYGGFARQGLGGYGINRLEQKLKGK